MLDLSCSKGDLVLFEVNSWVCFYWFWFVYILSLIFNFVLQGTVRLLCSPHQNIRDLVRKNLKSFEEDPSLHLHRIERACVRFPLFSKLEFLPFWCWFDSFDFVLQIQILVAGRILLLPHCMEKEIKTVTSPTKQKRTISFRRVPSAPKEQTSVAMDL